MRRSIEFACYALFILFFLVRYADVDDRASRRPPPTMPSREPAVLLPKGAALPRDISPNVVVDVELKSQNSVGTAFAVDDAGTYVTARHVVEGCRDVSLVRGKQLLRATLVGKASNRDFAVLRTRDVIAVPFLLSIDAPRRGDDGFMMGYPQGEPADVYATVIGSTTMRSRGRYNIKELVFAWVERERQPAFGGSLGGISGGPVFDTQGSIIGTVVAGAPRRGRVYTTNPRVFQEAGLVPQNVLFTAEAPLAHNNYAEAGKRFRGSMRIAQVYCRAS